MSFLFGRLLSALLVVVGVTSLVFFLIHMVPGDPVDVMLGESATPSDKEQLRALLGLDQPLFQQWSSYLYAIARLDLGVSMHSHRPIIDLLLERLPATLELAIAALAVTVLIAFPLGILAATHKNTPLDHASMTLSLLGVSIPNFLLGPILILLFAVYLGWLPVSGRESPAALVLPALTLGSGLAAILARMIRANVLEQLAEDYIRTARAKGVGNHALVWRHALKNAMLPVTTLLGLQLGNLLAGAVITEVVFSWPGIGQLTIDAIQQRDYPVLQACVLFVSVSYVVVNTLTDILYGVLDPRINME